MPYVITNACVDIMDRRCMEVCPVDCIKEGERMLYIEPDVCIDCGACAQACPQGAIFTDANLPPSLTNYREVNAQFFLSTDWGPAEPDAGRFGGVDHPVVAKLPRRVVAEKGLAGEAGRKMEQAQQEGRC